MRLLIDTHALLWLMQSDPKLSAKSAELIADGSNELFLSTASIWEIAIKSGLGKLGLTVPYERFLSVAIKSYGLIVLPITVEDCTRYEQLDFPSAQHRDPFDRMLVVQCQSHSLKLLSSDVAFDNYSVDRVW